MNKKLIYAALVILPLLGGVWWWKSRGEGEIKFKSALVEKGDLKLSILTTGTVQPLNRLEIKPPVAGRVDSVLVREGDHIKKGQILAWMSSTERAALIDAARSKGTDEVKKWEEIYRPTPIIAPITGTLILRNIEAGQTLTATDAMLVLSDKLTVNAQVDETDLAQVKLKNPAEIILDAYSDKTIPSLVDQIAFEAKIVNNVTTYLVDVLPIKTPDFMRSGMTANVTIFVDHKKDVLLIPNEFIQTKTNKFLVQVQSSDPKAIPQEREIQIGKSDGRKTEIIKGLSQGETVVIEDKQGKKKSRPNSGPFSPMGGGAPRGR